MEDCEFYISKENNTFSLRKERSNYFLSISFENKDYNERIGIKISEKKLFEDLLFDYIDELTCAKTVRNFQDYNSQQKIREKENYEEWKVTYQDKRKKDNKKTLVSLLVALVMFSVIIISGYYLFSGEYKFIGQKTKHIKAKIVNVSVVPVSGGYMQNINYEYIYDNNIFHGIKQIGRSIGVKEKGDYIKIKISIIKPRRHIVVAYYD